MRQTLAEPRNGIVRQADQWFHGIELLGAVLVLDSHPYIWTIFCAYTLIFTLRLYKKKRPSRQAGRRINDSTTSSCSPFPSLAINTKWVETTTWANSYVHRLWWVHSLLLALSNPKVGGHIRGSLHHMLLISAFTYKWRRAVLCACVCARVRACSFCGTAGSPHYRLYTEGET